MFKVTGVRIVYVSASNVFRKTVPTWWRRDNNTAFVPNSIPSVNVIICLLLSIMTQILTRKSQCSRFYTLLLCKSFSFAPLQNKLFSKRRELTNFLMYTKLYYGNYFNYRIMVSICLNKALPSLLFIFPKVLFLFLGRNVDKSNLERERKSAQH